MPDGDHPGKVEVAARLWRDEHEGLRRGFVRTAAWLGCDQPPGSSEAKELDGLLNGVSTNVLVACVSWLVGRMLLQGGKILWCMEVVGWVKSG